MRCYVIQSTVLNCAVLLVSASVTEVQDDSSDFLSFEDSGENEIEESSETRQPLTSPSPVLTSSASTTANSHSHSTIQSPTTESSLTTHSPTSYRAASHSSTTTNSLKPHSPTTTPLGFSYVYNFDRRLCKQIGDRVLCGLHRNIQMSISNQYTEMNGLERCRIRYGRVECGYENTPPVTPLSTLVYEYVTERADLRRQNKRSQDSHLEAPDAKESSLNGGNSRFAVKMNEGSSDNQEVFSTTSCASCSKTEEVTRCVEINERIVCTKKKIQ